MQTLNQLLEADQLGLTVYLPECARSRLWGNLDQAIHEATGYEPVYRRWIIHDYNSVMRFYAEDEDEIPQSDNPQVATRKYDDIPFIKDKVIPADKTIDPTIIGFTQAVHHIN